MKLSYWHVDAFSLRPFGGNQAAVIVLEQWLPDAILQAIGQENNFAETAFVAPDETGETDWDIRWFTPTHEVALCGHATLAAGHVLLQRDGGHQVTFNTRESGQLKVRLAEEGYTLALPQTLVEQEDNPKLIEALGHDGEVYISVSGAEKTAIILMKNEAAVRALDPNMRQLIDTGLMVICTARGSKSDIVSRVFVPAWGVDEDSVTGSAHAALGPFWAERLGRDKFSAYQASRRGGHLSCQVVGDQVWLGGPCVTVVEGVFRMPSLDSDPHLFPARAFSD